MSYHVIIVNEKYDSIVLCFKIPEGKDNQP